MYFWCYNLFRHFFSFWFQLWLSSSKNGRFFGIYVGFRLNTKWCLNACVYHDSKKQRNSYYVNFLNVFIFFNQPNVCQTDTDKNKVQNPGIIIIYHKFILSFMHEFHCMLLIVTNTTQLHPYNLIFLLLAFINIWPLYCTVIFLWWCYK